TLLFHLFAGHPTLLDASFRQFIWLSGSLTLLVAGVLAITAVHLKRFIGGVLLLDMSLTILCLTLPQDVAWKTAVTLQISRFGGLLLLAAGWELLQRDRLRQNLPDWPLDKLPLGLGRQVPAALALFGLGLFSLLGLPFTLGFGGHWRLLTAVGNLANQGNLPWWLPALTLLSLGLGAAAVWRVLGTLLQKPAEENEAPTMYNPLWLNVMVGLAFLLALWLALFPTAIINLVTSVLQISQNLS
ncbi:MAG: hypothetical protein GY805_34230, partial [Chloroflexi bacterium]|nr:hypothetical protein [Chloroflexota bacterium]